MASPQSPVRKLIQRAEDGRGCVLPPEETVEVAIYITRQASKLAAADALIEEYQRLLAEDDAEEDE